MDFKSALNHVQQKRCHNMTLQMFLLLYVGDMNDIYSRHILGSACSLTMDLSNS